MESKEKLKYLTNLLIKKLDNSDIDLTEEENNNVVNYYKDIKKDLESLETLLKYLPIKLEIKKDRNNQEHAYLIILSKERYLPVNYEYEIPMKKYELLKEVFNGKL